MLVLQSCDTYFSSFNILKVTKTEYESKLYAREEVKKLLHNKNKIIGLIYLGNIVKIDNSYCTRPYKKGYEIYYCCRTQDKYLIVCSALYIEIYDIGTEKLIYKIEKIQGTKINYVILENNIITVGYDFYIDDVVGILKYTLLDNHKYKTDKQITITYNNSIIQSDLPVTEEYAKNLLLSVGVDIESFYYLSRYAFVDYHICYKYNTKFDAYYVANKRIYYQDFTLEEPKLIYKG
jgi:hypothetical protein